MEKVIIVDENDTFVRICERDKWKEGEIHRSSVLWISNSVGEILIAQRSFSKKHAPGKWGPAATGTVNEGESYESNIQKEAKEELNLDIRLEQLLFGNKVVVGKPSNRRMQQWFMARIDIPLEELKPQEEEVAAIRWVHWSKLEKELLEAPDEFVGANPQVFPQLIEWTKRSNLVP